MLIHRPLWAIAETAFPTIEAITRDARANPAALADRIKAARGPAMDSRREPNGKRVAVLPLTGVIEPHPGMFTAYGYGTPLDGFRQLLRQALDARDVDSIAIYCSSPGGNVDGVEETGAMLAAAREKKKIHTLIDGYCCSAAYWLGSAAHAVVANPSAEIGSVGVYMAHEDVSGSLEQQGVKITFVQSGKYKTEGNAFEPLGNETREHLQASCDDVYRQFIGAVAKNRRVSRQEVLDKFGQGRTYPAREALERKLIDRIMLVEDYFGVLTQAGLQAASVDRAKQAKLARLKREQEARKRDSAESDREFHMKLSGYDGWLQPGDQYDADE